MDIFKPDIFSKAKPKWRKSIPSLENKLGAIISNIISKSNYDNILIEAPSSIEINSANFRISFLDKKYVLKKWGSSQELQNLENIEKIILFLDKNKIPVPKIIKFKKNQTILHINSNLWTCSEFKDGEYFSGKKNQFNELMELTTRTSNILLRLPKEIHPKLNLKYEIDKIYTIFKKTETLCLDWENIFGIKISTLLNNNWNKISKICETVKSSNIDAGPIFPTHYDLHPHNFLFNGSNPICLLDFESIVKIPVGFSISYSVLKQCRQLISFNKEFKSASLIGEKYMDFLIENLEINDLKWIDNFKTLAQTETLRRIANVFMINYQGNKDWNKVLPMLISNLKEAEVLFNK